MYYRSNLKSPVPAFPASYFLDREIFEQSNLTLPASIPTPSPQLNHAIAAPLAISTAYFEWAHLWMPVISKKRWFNLHLHSDKLPNNSVQILLLCMKLILWKPGITRLDRDPRMEEYYLAKQALSEAEQCGTMSLPLLQAMLLLSIYEYAHAVYPAAYMTIAACVRYSTAIGIHKQRREDHAHTDMDLDAQEERRRVWWAIVILDRVLPSDGVSSADPRPDDLLPVHDQSWDDGTFDETDMFPVSSPASTSMGMFARLAQASHLMGKVLRHKSTPTKDRDFDGRERTQLQHALRALLNLTYEEGSTRFMPICPQTALCYSAMVILNSSAENSDSLVGIADSTISRGILEILAPIANESLLSTQLYYRNRPWSLDRSSPLLLRWSYLIAVTFLKLSQSTRSVAPLEDPWASANSLGRVEMAQEDAVRGYWVMRSKLTLLGQRWCAADEYLRLLDARISIAEDSPSLAIPKS